LVLQAQGHATGGLESSPRLGFKNINSAVATKPLAAATFRQGPSFPQGGARWLESSVSGCLARE